MRWLLLSLLCGCQFLYGVDSDSAPRDAKPVDASAIDAPRATDTLVPIDGAPAVFGYITPDDMDGDGLTGSADLCPSISSKDDPMSQVDSDGDGVGDSCDPNPQLAGDCLVLADDLVGTLDGRWITSGTWMYEGQNCGGNSTGLCGLDQASSAFLLFQRELDAEEVDVKVFQGGADGSQVESVFVGSQLTGVDDVSGRACGYDNFSANPVSAVVDLTDGAGATVGATQNDSGVFSNGNNHLIKWRTDSACHVDSVGLATGSSGSAASGATVGIRIARVTLSVESIVAYSRHCPARF